MNEKAKRCCQSSCAPKLHNQCPSRSCCDGDANDDDDDDDDDDSLLAALMLLMLHGSADRGVVHKVVSSMS